MFGLGKKEKTEKERQQKAAELVLSAALKNGKVSYAWQALDRLGRMITTVETGELVAALDRRTDDTVADDIYALIRFNPIDTPTADRMCRRMVELKPEYLKDALYGWRKQQQVSLDLWQKLMDKMLEEKIEGFRILRALHREDLPPAVRQTYAEKLMQLSLQRGDDTTLFSVAEFAGMEVNEGQKETLLFAIMSQGFTPAHISAVFNAAKRAVA